MASSEYISRDAVLDAISEWLMKALHPENMSSYNEGERAAYRTALSEIADIPAVDVRPVVRCRECVHWERYDNTAGCGFCHKVKFEYGANGYVYNPVREPDFYCADGRKADV